MPAVSFKAVDRVAEVERPLALVMVSSLPDEEDNLGNLMEQAGVWDYPDRLAP
jgi:hypothetical protein